MKLKFNNKNSIAIILLFLTIVIPNCCVAQAFDLIDVRSFNSSLILSLSEKQIQTYSWREYGLSRNQISNNTNSRYLFQSQEYDRHLDMHLFKSRIYNSTLKRFIQPDPQSQYHGPYVFAGSDPINFIDYDGNVAKPLILFQEDHSEIDGLRVSTRDLMSQVKDAHYMPISDFINGKFENIGEWNGNIFIKGHMGTEEGKEILSERGKYRSLKKRTDMGKIVRNESNPAEFDVRLSGRELGEQIFKFSEAKGVPIQNIVAGGCEGSVAAEAIGKGVQGSVKSTAGRKFSVFGLKRGKNAYIAGRIRTREGGEFVGLRRARFHVKGKGGIIYPVPKPDEYPDGLERFDKYGVYEKGKAPYYMKYAEGKELDDLVNGRIPKTIEEDFLPIHLSY